MLFCSVNMVYINVCHEPINHGLATPNIDKTTTNNILPTSLSAYAVRIGRCSNYVDRRWSVISVHFRID